jgi:hypothetical protein
MTKHGAATYSTRAMRPLPLLFLALIGCCQPAFGQEADDSGGLPRVGTLIDRSELEYFHLFAYNKGLEMVWVGTRDAEGQQLTLTSDGAESTVRLDTLQLAVLRHWLQSFEGVCASGLTTAGYFADSTRPLLTKAAGRLIHAGMLPEVPPQRSSCPAVRLLLRDGSRFDGHVMAMRDSVIAFADTRPSQLPVDRRISIRHVTEIDSVLVSHSVASVPHRVTYWLLGGMVGMLIVSEASRNSSEGPGGSGSPPASLTGGMLLGGLVGWITSLAGNVDTPGFRPDDVSLAELREAIAPDDCLGPAPPEVIDAMQNDVPPRYPLRGKTEEIARQVAVRWEAPFSIGLAMNLNVYGVKSRPFGVLPGLALSWQLPLLRDGDRAVALALRGMAGISYYGGGSYLRFRQSSHLRFFVGFEYLRNNDDLGKYTVSTMSRYVKYETAMQRERWQQESYLTVGIDVPLRTAYLTLQYRHALEAALVVAETRHNTSYVYVTNLRAPVRYGGFAVSMSAPFSLSDLF